jgi:hypothetical protein
LQYITDPEVPTLFDPWDYLGPKRRRMLDSGWAGLFQKKLLKELPVARIAPRFHPSFGRPTKELHTMLGMLVLQQMRDLTDVEVVTALAYNLQWQYALNLAGETDAEKYVSERTVRSYRGLLIELELDGILFESLTAVLAKVFKVPKSKQRLDSTHILSNMRRLSRIGLFQAVITRFLKCLKRQHAERYDSIPRELVERYLTKKGKGCFGQPKPSRTQETLQRTAEDVLLLVEMFRNDEAVTRMASYRMLQRLLSEQCEVKGEDGEGRVEVKPPKEIRSDSLQNPSDPEATYDGHKGQGYQVQLVETYQEMNKDDERIPDLITYVEVEGAHLHDGQALAPAVDSLEERELLPESMLGDTSFGSDGNVQYAAKHGVELITPAPGGGAEERLGLEDFEIEETRGEIISCPAGEKPIAVHRSISEKFKTYIFVALFDVDACMSCENMNRCPKRLGVDTAEVRYDEKQLRLAVRRRVEKTEEFREKYRWRAGLEATNARYKSQTGAGRLRVRSLPSVRYAAKLKALGLNILRCGRARAAILGLEGALQRFRGLWVSLSYRLASRVAAHSMA